MTELKRCSNCKCTQILETYFSKNRKGEYLKTCNRCRESQKKNYQKNKDTIKEKVKVYRESNKEKAKLSKKNSYEKSKEYYINKTKQWVDQNLEKRWLYLETNKDKNSLKHKEYLHLHKDRLKVISQEYITNKRHHCLHNSHRANCKICNPNGHLKGLVSSRVWGALKRNKSKKSLEYLGCDIPTFKEHIEKSFKEGMNWDNHGYGDDCWNIDHIIPVLYKQDNIEPSVEEVGKRLHYTNCQALWSSENISKGNRYISDYRIDSESD